MFQSSPELRALAAKLELAYINKERAAQVSSTGRGILWKWWSIIKVAERRLAGREEELARQKEEEETKLEREVILSSSIALSFLQDFSLSFIMFGKFYLETWFISWMGSCQWPFSCQMIEERDRREIVEEQIAKIRSMTSISHFKQGSRSARLSPQSMAKYASMCRIVLEEKEVWLYIMSKRSMSIAAKCPY